ncbi:hypothetical protein BH11MYX1_BH11MYX1_02150 [soil metagenome]
MGYAAGVNEYILLHHDDATAEAGWNEYLAKLRASGQFDGGSSIGAGACFNKSGPAKPTSSVVGFVRVRAESLDAARTFLAGNPVYEAGGTVEIRELPKS